jgi:hypothetical protein
MELCYLESSNKGGDCNKLDDVLDLIPVILTEIIKKM